MRPRPALPDCGAIDQAADKAAVFFFVRQLAMKPRTITPISIMVHVDGKGVELTSVNPASKLYATP